MRPAVWVGWRRSADRDSAYVVRTTITVERESGEVLCERCLVADTFWTRLRGLIGRKGLAESEGLLIRPSGSVHTFFMRFPIDVVFLDRTDAVVKVVPALRPRRLAAARRARRVLELSGGVCARRGLTVGERLQLVPGVSGEQPA
jgi:uncharacterized membrane protein (UPF0127 family)